MYRVSYILLNFFQINVSLMNVLHLVYSLFGVTSQVI